MLTQAHATDVYVSGLDHIELIGGGCARFVCYINTTDEDGKVFRLPAPVNILFPIDQIPDGIRKASKVAANQLVGAIVDLIPLSTH